MTSRGVMPSGKLRRPDGAGEARRATFFSTRIHHHTPIHLSKQWQRNLWRLRLPCMRPMHISGACSPPSQNVRGQSNETTKVENKPHPEHVDELLAESRASTPMSVAICQTGQLREASSIEEAMRILRHELATTANSSKAYYKSGLLRLEVPLPRGVSPLWWLNSQQNLLSDVPHIYFSPRRTSAPGTRGAGEAASVLSGWGSVAGLGAAWQWKGKPGQEFNQEVFGGLKRFLSPGAKQIRVFGGTRFDQGQVPSKEWAEFGSFMFLLPQLELVEGPENLFLCCSLAWEPPSQTSLPPSAKGNGPTSLQDAVEAARKLLDAVSLPLPMSANSVRVERESVNHLPGEQDWYELLEKILSDLEEVPVHDGLNFGLNDTAAMQEFLDSGQKGLDDLLSALAVSMSDDDLGPKMAEVLTKVVPARRTDLKLKGELDALNLLTTLQERDPHAYQLCLGAPGGGCFVGSTPERLYARSGTRVASEAVAGTRPRGPKGDVEKDFWLGYDLLQNPKDHVEFTLVRDWLRDALDKVCNNVEVEVSKSILKQGNVQHLYAKLCATIQEGRNDADLIGALHPTPAVCGRPQNLAKEFLREVEPFDRGFYAGPFGWISGDGAEFVVAIRSALISTPNADAHTLVDNSSSTDEHSMSLYAGVGVVQGSDPESEWNELNLKISQFDKLLVSGVSPFRQPNANMMWTTMLVEELCRLGMNTFGVAPGSRSSPLTAAVAAHPRARIVPCIDERSLGFWALGYSKATGLPAPVITSSGTAVANLLPAVVEASTSRVPMLLLTADRPSELRDTGANQTIDQVKIFGDYVRWTQDVPTPDSRTPPRMLLTSVDTAFRMAKSHPCGPVHLNMQFREPLAPVSQDGSFPEHDQILHHWWTSKDPFTIPQQTGGVMKAFSGSQSLSQVLPLIQTAQRGLLVMGELSTPQEVFAAKQVAKLLGWPVLGDVLSGLKVGSACGDACDTFVMNADHILLDKEQIWPALKPDVVLQIGGHLTSKRLGQFLEWSASADDRIRMPWIYVGSHALRDDPFHLVSHRLQCDALSLRYNLSAALSLPSSNLTSNYLHAWKSIDNAVERAIADQMRLLNKSAGVCEPYVAREVSRVLPPGCGLFLGNSMPIRDMEMYACGEGRGAVGVPVAANRGASGIDGVLSTAAGFAVGLGKPVTLVIGDISFLHDTNGLNMLRSGESWPPLTIVLVNNSGGGIFSFLPISDSVAQDTFNSLWATPQHVDIEGMCRAHGVLHQKVCRPEDLREAMNVAWNVKKHSVVEVITNRDTNVEIHREIQDAVKAAALQAVALLPTITGSGLSNNSIFRVRDVSWKRYSLPLKKPLTTRANSNVRIGGLIMLTLESAAGERFTGVGDICPLPGLHPESVEDAERQVAMLSHLLRDSQVPMSLAMLNGNLEEWFENEMGIHAEELHRSVRFGMETALLTALANSKNASLSELLSGSGFQGDESILVNGLVDPAGNLDNAVKDALDLVSNGYTAIKIKVARDLSPEEDAEIVLAVRNAVGPAVVLRADANRGWSLDEAVRFGQRVSKAGLQYIEEPTSSPNCITDFFSKTGVPCALDETVDELVEGGVGVAELEKFRGAVTAVVLKPSVIGSMEKVVSILRGIRPLGMLAVISAAFESSVGLGVLSHIAAHANYMGGINGEKSSIAHGLGTASWFTDNVHSWEEVLKTNVTAGESLNGSNPVMHLEQSNVILTSVSSGEGVNASTTVHSSIAEPDSFTGKCVALGREGSVRVLETGPLSVTGGEPSATLVFLHGFLGTADDWLPLLNYFRQDYRCLSVDLPGHGGSTVRGQDTSIHSVADAILGVLDRLGVEDCILIGYSMGARVALQMAAGVASNGRSSTLRVSKVVSVSGTSGISGVAARGVRADRDDQLAEVLCRGAVNQTDFQSFLDVWYKSPLWNGVRGKRGVFRRMLEQRGVCGDPEALALALSGMSTGRMEPLDDALCSSETDFLFVAGSDDLKFYNLAKKMSSKITASSTSNGSGARANMVAIPQCAHAVHLENPLALAERIRDFLNGKSG